MAHWRSENKGLHRARHVGEESFAEAPAISLAGGAENRYG
jgi:hypothetical protein